MSVEDNKIEKWVDSVTDLLESYRQLLSIRMVEHTSLGVSMSFSAVVALILGCFVLLFTGIGTAWWLGEYLNNMKVGFFIVGGLYTLLLIVLALSAVKVWIPRLRNFVIKKIYEQD